MTAPAPAKRVRNRVRRDRVGRILEIDGLRGFALTLVVLFHLFGQGRVSGGVDVFLVVSGFLLTASLTRAMLRGRRIGVWRRWARILGRLAPPAALTLLFIVVMTVTVIPPWTREQNLREVVAALLYVENWELISSQLAYGAAGPLTSPVQHFWSLSVQAQVFILLPVLAWLVVMLVRRWGASAVVFHTLLLLATGASFWYAYVRNIANADAAYFDSLARFWELGLGGLLAGLLRAGLSLPGWLRVPLGWAGLIAVAGSGLVVDGAVSYPGPLALIPVGGAVCVILSAGARQRGSAAAVLRSRPLVALDRISYHLYLWHWPILIGYLALGESSDVAVLGPWDAAIVLAVSVAVALVSRLLFRRPTEELLRTGQPAITLAGVGAAGLVVALSVGLATSPEAGVEVRPALAADSCRGAAALDPQRPQCHDKRYDELLPPYDDLNTDGLYPDECWSWDASDGFGLCSYGPRTGYTKRLLAVGDSHNMSWIPAYQEIAENRNWRIDVAGRTSCFWTTALRYQNTKDGFRGCKLWQDELEEHLQTAELDGIITVQSGLAIYDGYHPNGWDARDVISDGLVEAWAQRPDMDVPVFAIKDNPVFDPDFLTCALDAEAAQDGECETSRRAALHDEGFTDAVPRDPNAHLIDLTDYMCTEHRCSLVVGGLITTRDGSHLNATFARTLAPYLERALVDGLG